MGDKLYTWAERSDEVELEDLYLRSDGDVDEVDDDIGVEKRNPTGQRKPPKKSGKAVEAEAEAEEKKNPKPKQQKPPIRDFITYDMVSYLTSALIEGQLRSSGLSDGNGLGQKPMSKWYKQVWEPCVKPVREEGEDGEMVDLEEEGVVRVSNSTGSTETSESKETTEGRKGAPVAGGGGTGGGHGGQDQDQDKGKGKGKAVSQGKAAWAASGAIPVAKREDRNTGAKMGEKTETVCNFPDDFLFYTPFTLGSRAIRAIAKEAAEKVRRGDSFRQMEAEDEGLWAGVQGHVG